MIRDMDLIRKILLAIEAQYKPGQGHLSGLNIDGYDLQIIAEHCDLLFQQELITSYKPIRGHDVIIQFQVGNLSSAGYDFLELIRDEEVWEKTKAKFEERKLPKTIKFFAEVAGTFVGNVIKGINS